jgi:A/G-specific adenine glycosylase
MLSPFPWHELEAWFRNKGRHDLPWRQIFDRDDATRGYQVYLSEIILQQTQVERGKLYFERILDRFPTIQALANTTFESLFRVTSGLGYYRRMHMMIETAKIVSSQYGGIFPRNPEELEKLPGIGTYTARAIAAFTYEEPFLSFDTNLKKIFSRFYHGSRLIPLSNKEQREIENDFRKSGYSSRMINGALMDF